MNKAYTLKQILFALRKEYIEVEKKLKDLEKYVNITGEIDDISFHVHDFNVPKTIDMYLRKKQTILDKIRETLGLTGIYTRGVAFWMVPSEIEQACYWKRKKVCSITDLDGFTKDIKDIVESDFIKNTILDVMGENNNFALNINARGASATGYKKENDFSVIGYNSKVDTMSVRRKQSIITLDYIYDLFNIEFGSEIFNDYYKEIIDNYEEKEIDIVDTFDSNHSQLEIIEKQKKLILKPKKII